MHRDRFVGYGGAGGGIRAIEQLRQVVIELNMIPTRAEVDLSRAYQMFRDGPPDDPALDRAAGAVLDEVVRRARALAAGAAVPPATQAPTAAR